MEYTRIFDASATTGSHPPVTLGQGRRRAASAPEYDCPVDLELAINVACATGQPLLVRGEPGSGKSTLASWIARKLGWRYYQHIVTSRTEARDLLWRFEAVHRLADAQLGDPARLKPDEAYVEPGPLWWAFDAELAARRGAKPGAQNVPLAKDPSDRKHVNAVVLIDEIDKADPDLPNNLLDVLESRRFVIEETRCAVEAETVPLMVIATNEERDLPRAFLRRCVVVELPAPTAERLRAIAAKHFQAPEHLEWAVTRTMSLRAEATERRIRPPSIAEFLDLLAAVQALGPSTDDVLRLVSCAALWKDRDAPTVTATAGAAPPGPG